MNNADKVSHLLEMAKNGDFGTPENPVTNFSGRQVFWWVYTGWRKPSEYSGTVMEPYAKAAILFKNRKDDDNA